MVNYPANGTVPGVLHPDVVNLQYLRTCHVTGRLPIAPYIIYFALAALMPLAFAVIGRVQGLQFQADGLRTNDLTDIPWFFYGGFAAMLGIMVGLGAALPARAGAQFDTAYTTARIIEFEWINCQPCGGKGRGEQRQGRTKCLFCDGLVVVRGKAAAVASIAIPWMCVIDNINMELSGSGMESGFGFSDILMQAPRGVRFVEDLTHTSQVFDWPAVIGNIRGDSSRGSFQIIREVADTGLMSPYRPHRNPIEKIVKEWPGPLIMAGLIIAAILVLSMDTNSGTATDGSAAPTPSVPPPPHSFPDYPASGCRKLECAVFVQFAKVRRR